MNSEIRGQRVIVTGASGFIGLHLCRFLLRQGAEVHGLCRSKPAIASTQLRWRKLDLSDYDATNQAFTEIRADLVFHLCSYAQGERDLPLVLPTFRSELQTSVNVLTTATEMGCKRVIMAGSLEESEQSDIPSSPYAAAKTASRMYGRMFHQLYSLPVVMTRIFMVYGPGQSTKKLIPYAATCMFRGEAPKIASPDREVDWIYIDDVVRGLTVAATTPGLEGKSLDLGSGRLVEIREIVNLLHNFIKSAALPQFGTVSMRGREEVRCADAVATYTLTGWRPTVSLAEGLKRTVESTSKSLREVAFGDASALP